MPLLPFTTTSRPDYRRARYQLKWLDINTPLTLGIWAAGGIPIGHGGFMQFNRPHVYGWRCASCCKIIVDERA